MSLTQLTTPRLETERLWLRGWSVDDLDGLCQIFSTEENAHFIGGKKERWQCYQYLLAEIGHWCIHGWGKFVIEEKASGSFAGFCGPAFADGWPEPEISYSLAPRSQGKGYAFEAVKRSILFVYDVLGWQRAVSQIDKDNPASRKVSQKLGAVKETEGVELPGYVVDIWRHLPPQEFRERFA